MWISTPFGRSLLWRGALQVAIVTPPIVAVNSMDPTEDLNRALVLLGLEQLPANPSELSRLVVHRHPATAVWSAEQSWAYRMVWNRCITSGPSAIRHPGRR